MSDRQDLHNKGEQDATDGKYDPPDTTPIIFQPVTTERQREEERKDKETYDEGYENGKKQRGW